MTLFAPVVTPAILARDAVRRADDVEDSRLKAVYALRATRLAVGAAREAQVTCPGFFEPLIPGRRLGLKRPRFLHQSSR